MKSEVDGQATLKLIVSLKDRKVASPLRRGPFLCGSVLSTPGGPRWWLPTPAEMAPRAFDKALMGDAGVVGAACLLYEHDLADAASLLVAHWSDASNRGCYSTAGGEAPP